MTTVGIRRSVRPRRKARVDLTQTLSLASGPPATIALLLFWFLAGLLLYLHQGGLLGLIVLAVPLAICLAVVQAQHLLGASTLWLVISPALFPLLNFPQGNAILTFDRLWLLPLGLAYFISAPSQQPARLGLLGSSGLAFAIIFGVRAAFSGPQVLSAVGIWVDAIVLPVLVFLVIRRLAAAKENRLRLAGAMAWGGTFIALLGVTERLFGYELASLTGGVPRTDSGLPGLVRVSGPYTVPEVYSLVLVATLACTLYWWQSTRLRGGLVAISVALQVLGLVNSLFRISWLSGLIVLVVVLGFRPRRTVRAVASIVGMAFLAGLALIPLESSSVFSERAGNTANVFGRFATYGQALDVFQTSPVVGVGVGNYNFVASRLGAVYVEGVRSVDFAHNSFLAVLAEQGIVGFVAMLGVAGGLGVLARRLWRTSQTKEHEILAAMVVGALIGYLGFSLTLTMISYGDSNIYFAALLGIGAGALTEIRNKGRSAETPCGAAADVPISAHLT